MYAKAMREPTPPPSTKATAVRMATLSLIGILLPNNTSLTDNNAFYFLNVINKNYQ
jgi:hypothetical protein